MNVVGGIVGTNCVGDVVIYAVTTCCWVVCNSRVPSAFESQEEPLSKRRRGRERRGERGGRGGRREGRIHCECLANSKHCTSTFLALLNQRQPVP